MGSREVIPPLERLETGLHPWVGFVIMPLFAFANAGVVFSSESLVTPVAMAVIQALLYDEDTDEDDRGKEEQTYVFVMQGGKAIRKDIEVGISSDSDQEITGGLEEGEIVITGPFRILRHLIDDEEVEEAEGPEDNDDAAEIND